jgi:hypothetical protein
MFTQSIGLIVWNLGWFAGGLTTGERVALRTYVRVK